MDRDYFPIKIDEVAADVKFEHLKPNESFRLDGAVIDTFNVYHSSPTLTFKIKENGKTIVYMTDNELDVPAESDNNSGEKLREKNKELINFCKGCDYLIHDMMFEDFDINKSGWGHSSSKALIQFGIMAGVKNIILFHYNPAYTDSKIDGIVAQTQFWLKQYDASTNCIAAREGLKISL